MLFGYLSVLSFMIMLSGCLVVNLFLSNLRCLVQRQHDLQRALREWARTVEFCAEAGGCAPPPWLVAVPSEAVRACAWPINECERIANTLP